MSRLPKAFIFDLNGTLIDDMLYHIEAWHEVVKRLGANLSHAVLKKEMYGKNQEVLVRLFGSGRFSDEEMDRISLEKERSYQEVFRPHLKGIEGLDNFLKYACDCGIPMAIGSAAIRLNVDFVLDGLQLRPYFKAAISADNVARSKPDPETFLKAAQALQMVPEDCLVFEDAPKGVEAAHNAGMQAIVITTMHTQAEFAAYSNIRAFVADYTDPVLQTLFEKAIAI